MARLCADLGHEVVEAAPRYDGQAFEDAFLDLWSQEASTIRANMLRRGVPEHQLERVLEPWTLYLAEHFESSVAAPGLARAHEVFVQVDRTVADFMGDFDLWLTPVLTSTPPRIGEQGPLVSPEVLQRRTFEYVAYTYLANITGAPAISLPLSWSADGMPIGSMFYAAAGQERMLLELAYQLEEAQPWAQRRPNLG